ncbi:protein of unknown function [Candidatus Hydrogenisulfobacillus filiaventi]|uniref:Uncharacterized protein n=1 Tax=Candidatus Hydrogenisulfobacillus filiaventi TaxID=2707344 RepID=A0A6F8ZHB5_9FIRM|nr:hypothetical protein [Bacillota bacterium]CAB1129176.1 protein of unknown function [Candidatus Hydrogenisulfobacillus filiaventi]
MAYGRPLGRPRPVRWGSRPLAVTRVGRLRAVALVLALLALAGLLRLLPLFLWPLGIGLWLLWAALGPLVAVAALVWLIWRLFAPGGGR